jgi:diaminopimelate epimerase
MNRSFLKMTGTGNDFLVFDDRDGTLGLTSPERWADLCTRRTGVGADGVLLLQGSERADYRMGFLNADGIEAGMCGNGARCLAMAAAVEFGLGREYSVESSVPAGWSMPAGIGSRQIWSLEFEAGDGGHHALGWGQTVLTTIGPPDAISPLELETAAGRFEGYRLDTGVPHFVTRIEDMESLDITAAGSGIRYHPEVGETGANANFLGREPDPDGAWPIRTWERGVEDETLACGTGCAAAASILALEGIPTPVALKAPGGILKVHFTRVGDEVRDLWLEGSVGIVYRGTIADI